MPRLTLVNCSFKYTILRLRNTGEMRVRRGGRGAAKDYKGLQLNTGERRVRRRGGGRGAS